MPPTNDGPTRRLEVLAGRSLAMFVHPSAAWRSRSTNQRAGLLFAYFAFSYLLTFGLLRLIAA
jgi:hypothetical protein